MKKNVSKENVDEQGVNPLSIIEVIGAKVKLIKNGKKHHGPCPFHHGKSNTFYVDEERGTFHCFVCNAGGTVEDFIKLC